MIDNLSFNICELEDIRPEFLKFAVGNHADETITAHLDPLRMHGSSLHATKHVRNSAERLATGYNTLCGAVGTDRHSRTCLIR